MELLDAALRLHAAGYAVLPVKPDGTKAPAVTWKAAQAERPGPEQLAAWFGTPAYDGLGLVCGAVSGNLEMLEVEGRAAALVTELGQALADHGFEDLWLRLCRGYLEQSPSGGFHWHYRVDGPTAPNTKLAKRPATLEELLDHQLAEREKARATIADPAQRAARLERIDQLTAERLPQVLIETRGEGGFTVAAPSGGRTHPTGKPWVVLAGSPETVPIITVEERDALFAIASLLDAMPAVEEPAQRPLAVAGVDKGARPGDDFNARATWDDILVPHGWTRAKKIGTGYGWVRPGKVAADGISATTGRNDGDNLYVFSTSTEFEEGRPYSKFAAYALLEHGGDYGLAAKQLRAEGYGGESTRPVPTVDLFGAAQAAAPAAVEADDASPSTDGALAVVHQLHATATTTPAQTDDANALALVETYGHLLRYCADRGRWYVWNGHVWAEAPRNHGPVREYAKQVARALPGLEKSEAAFRRRSLSAVGTTNMLTQAASDSRVAVTFADLDAQPWELNTPAGIVDLRTGAMMPSDPAKLHTRSTSCAPDPEADRSRWLRFLDTTFGGDQALIDYLQRLVGYSAVGVVGPHVLPYCHGSGGNGKGVFLETCVKVLGGYATTAPAGFLMAKVYQGHETEVARLAGARMVLCSEVNDDDRFDEGRVKLLTGGDTLTARFMHQDHFTFTPTHQLWAMGNHQPGVRAGGRSFWRRLRLIPFLHEVPPGEVIDDLQGILASEDGPAVLSWIVDGAVAYAKEGLVEPASVKAATAGYELDQDTVTRFLDECCLLGGGEHVQTKVAVVRAAYEAFCHETGDDPVSAKAFGLALSRAGVGSKRSMSARFYTGLHLLGDDENASWAERASRPTDEPAEGADAQERLL